MNTQKVIYGVIFSHSSNAYEARLYVSGSNNIIQKFTRKKSDENTRANLINEIVNYIETERMAEVLSFSFSEDFVLYIMAKVS